MKTVIVILGLALSCFGQDHGKLPRSPDQWLTAGRINGNFWKNAGDRKTNEGLIARVMFVLAVFESPACNSAETWPKGTDAVDVIDSLDFFYLDPANRKIPVLVAMDWVRKKLQGEDVRELEMMLRKTWNAR